MSVNTTQSHHERGQPERDSQGTTCPECGGRLLNDSEHGETVCQDCGLVINTDEIDHGPEWRSFDRQQRSRVGAPTTPILHDRGLSTTISWKNKDAHGRLLSPRKRQQMQRLRRQHVWTKTRDSQQQNFKKAFIEIDRMASALGLPKSVRETASVLYRRTHSEGLVRGRSIEAVAAAALHIAARQEGIPRTLDEMTSVARVDRNPIARAQRSISTELGLAIELADPRQYIPRFGSELDVDEKTLQKARAVLDAAEDTYLGGGKNPVGLAAAALYVASKLTGGVRLSQREVEDVTDITRATIQKHHPILGDYYVEQYV